MNENTIYNIAKNHLLDKTLNVKSDLRKFRKTIKKMETIMEDWAKILSFDGQPNWQDEEIVKMTQGLIDQTVKTAEDLLALQEMVTNDVRTSSAMAKARASIPTKAPKAKVADKGIETEPDQAPTEESGEVTTTVLDLDDAKGFREWLDKEYGEKALEEARLEIADAIKKVAIGYYRNGTQVEACPTDKTESDTSEDNKKVESNERKQSELLTWAQVDSAFSGQLLYPASPTSVPTEDTPKQLGLEEVIGVNGVMFSLENSGPKVLANLFRQAREKIDTLIISRHQVSEMIDGDDLLTVTCVFVNEELSTTDGRSCWQHGYLVQVLTNYVTSLGSQPEVTTSKVRSDIVACLIAHYLCPSNMDHFYSHLRVLDLPKMEIVRLSIANYHTLGLSPKAPELFFNVVLDMAVKLQKFPTHSVELTPDHGMKQVVLDMDRKSSAAHLANLAITEFVKAKAILAHDLHLDTVGVVSVNVVIQAICDEIRSVGSVLSLTVESNGSLNVLSLYHYDAINKRWINTGKMDDVDSILVNKIRSEVRSVLKAEIATRGLNVKITN